MGGSPREECGFCGVSAWKLVWCFLLRTSEAPGAVLSDDTAFAGLRHATLMACESVPSLLLRLRVGVRVGSAGVCLSAQYMRASRHWPCPCALSCPSAVCVARDLGGPRGRVLFLETVLPRAVPYSFHWALCGKGSASL